MEISSAEDLAAVRSVKRNVRARSKSQYERSFSGPSAGATSGEEDAGADRRLSSSTTMMEDAKRALEESGLADSREQDLEK